MALFFAGPTATLPPLPKHVPDEIEGKAFMIVGGVAVTKQAAQTEQQVHAPKIQPKSVGIEAVTLDPIEALCDEFIELHAKFEQLDADKMVKRMEAIKKELQSIANQQIEPGKVAVFSSPLGEVEFTKRTVCREIKDAHALIADLSVKMGDKVAFSCVKISMAELKKLLSENELGKYISESPGSRSLASVRRAS